jgi:hypothetical protein
MAALLMLQPAALDAAAHHGSALGDVIRHQCSALPWRWEASGTCAVVGVGSLAGMVGRFTRMTRTITAAAATPMTTTESWPVVTSRAHGICNVFHVMLQPLLYSQDA